MALVDAHLSLITSTPALCLRLRSSLLSLCICPSSVFYSVCERVDAAAHVGLIQRTSLRIRHGGSRRRGSRRRGDSRDDEANGHSSDSGGDGGSNDETDHQRSVDAGGRGLLDAHLTSFSGNRGRGNSGGGRALANSSGGSSSARSGGGTLADRGGSSSARS